LLFAVFSIRNSHHCGGTNTKSNDSRIALFHTKWRCGDRHETVKASTSD